MAKELIAAAVLKVGCLGGWLTVVLWSVFSRKTVAGGVVCA